MRNNEKAQDIVFGYADIIQQDAYDATLKMAEWKDKQFKEYLEKKLESIKECYQKSKIEYKKDYYSTQMVIIAEIINEVFKEE